MSDALAQQRIDGIVRALQARGWQDVAVVEEEMGYPFNDMEGEFHYRGGAAGLLRDDASILSPQTSSPEEWIAEFEEKVQDQVLDKGSTGAYDWDWDMFPESYRTMDRVFGYTDSLESAGYILPNGKLLDLSQGRGGRWQDHRAVSPFRPGGSPGTAGMQEFVSEGNVRMDANSGILDMSAPPTEHQKRRIREVAKFHRGEVTVDMKDGLGEKDSRGEYYYSPERSEKIEFPHGTNPATIINRIDGFFSMRPVEAASNTHLLKWAQRQQFMLPFYDPNEYTSNPVEIQPDLEDFTPEGEDLDEWVTGFYHVTSNLLLQDQSAVLQARGQKILKTMTGRPDFSGTDSRAHGLYAWMNRNCKFLQATKDKTKKNDLGHASWANKDIVFETNVPVEFPFVHMAQETPKMGEMFQQYIDPAGMYMTYNETGQTPAIKTDRIEAQYGMAKFENPLVIVFNTGDEFGYNEHSWKARLNEHYGKSGKALSRAIAADGYDGIVTVRQDVDPPVVSEIVDLRPFAKKAIAWLLRNCRFAQDREQLHFPFYDPSEYEPVVEENLEWPDPLYDQKQALQDMLDDRPQDIANFLKVYASLYSPEEFRFDDAASTKKANPITVVTVEGQRCVVEVSSERFGSMTEIGTWLEDLSEHDLGQYVGFKDFNEEFWDGADGLVLYHATDPDNVEDILRDGLSPRSDSRAMSNRNIGSAVFMGTSPETISSYGDAVIAIDVGAMKANGYMPRASQEEPFEKAHMKESLAHKLGIEEYEATDEYYRNEGLSEDTVVFFGPIPPQYLSLAE